MTMHITATFPDGAKLRRGTKKNYTHAWRVCWLRPLNVYGNPVDSNGTIYSDRNGSESGFASSYDLASRAAVSVANRVKGYHPGYEITKQDIVPIGDNQ